MLVVPPDRLDYTISLNAVFGKPIIIGKNYHKFPEAKRLIALGGVTSVSTVSAFESVIASLIKDPSLRAEQGSINTGFIEKNRGAVVQILDYIRI